MDSAGSQTTSSRFNQLTKIIYLVLLVNKIISGLRRTNKHKCFLRVRIEKEEDAVVTPEATSIDEEDEEIYQAAVLIGSVVRGRGTQVLVRETLF